MADIRLIDAAPVEQAVVSYLETVLARAKNGEYSAVAVAVVYRDGSTGSGYSNQYNLATMVGSPEQLKAKLLKDMEA